MKFSALLLNVSYRRGMMPKKLSTIAVIGAIVAGTMTAPAATAGTVTILEPTQMVWHPTDSNIAYVATDIDGHERGKTITKVDFSTTPATVTNLVTMTDPANCHANVNTLAITPDGTTLYAGGYSCVMKIDLANPTAYTSGFIGQGWVQQIVVGTNAAYAIHAEGGAVFKAVRSGDPLTWGSSWTQLVRPNNVGYPVSRSGSLTPDGATLFVGSEGAELRRINTSTGEETAVAGTVNGQYGTFAVAVDPKNGAYALVLDGERTIKRVDLTGANAGSVTATASVPERRLRDISIDADGAFAYVVADVDKTLLKIDPSDLSVVGRYTFPSTAGDVAASPISGRNSVLLTMPSTNSVLLLPAAPNAPTSLTPTAADESAIVNFTAAQDGFSTITNYEYRLDGTGAWTPLSPVDTTSPVTVPGLTNGTAVGIELRAVNAIGAGTASSSVSVTPEFTPGVPRSVNVSAGSRQVTIAFTAPSSDGGRAITNYEYSLNGGSTWTALSPASTASPIVVTGLTNGASYQVSLRAVNSLGGGVASTAVGVTPGDPTTGGSAPEPAAAPSSEPTPTASPNPTESTSSAPAVASVPEPVSVGESLVVVDGRVSRVAVRTLEGGTWQVKGEDFTLEFTPRAELGELEGTFTAKAGTQVDVRGDGFVAGSLIATYLPGALAASLGEATVAPDGTFSVTATFPATLNAGQYVFQVNGLATATSVRSVNLGVQLLAADPVARSAKAQRVIFAGGSSTLTKKARASITRFAVTHKMDAAQVIVVPTVHAKTDPDARKLARERAREVRNALRASGFTAPIRIASKIRTASDPTAGLRTTLWVRFQM